MQEINTVRSLFHLLSSRERISLLGLAPLLAVSSLVEMVGVGAIIVYLGTLDTINATGLMKLPFGTGTVSLGSQRFALVGGAVLFAVFVLKAVLITGIQFLVMRFLFGAFERFSTELFQLYLRAPLSIHLVTSS